MKKIFLPLLIAAFLGSCSGNQEAKEATTENSASDLMKDDEAKKVNDARGIGKFTNVEISPALDAAMAAEGTKVYDMKCSPCHRLTDEKLVGPGWKGVISRRTPEWIMNFSTNTDEMLNKDAEAQAMLELCMVRMPNQNLSDADARSVYEFMRKNDGVK
jgi:cytochrome c2